MERDGTACRPLRLALAAALALAGGSAVRADDGAFGLQGLFCNSEAQIDGTLAHIRKGLSPHTAVELANRNAVVCTYVDRLGYVVEGPVDIGRTGSSFAPVKYRGMLVGVRVGDNLRPVAPPVEIYFVTPGRIVDAAVERPT
jgi:hypothetical protein